MKYRVFKSEEFSSWYLEQSRKTQTIIDARLERIQGDGHFGYTRYFDGILELKWTSGMRIYTFLDGPVLIVVLYGGNKNGQDKDIRDAKKIKENYLRRTYPER